METPNLPTDDPEPEFEEIPCSDEACVHGKNLSNKESHEEEGTYGDEASKRHLEVIRERYDAWKASNLELRGPGMVPHGEGDFEIIQERVRLFNDYKEFIDQQVYAEHFDSRSNLHSTVLEEFLYYLFRDLVAQFSSSALIGKSGAFKDLFFMSKNYKDMVEHPNVHIETKNHDFAIGSKVISRMHVNGKEDEEDYTFEVPAVAIECKTYLDKNMLEGATMTVEQLLARNPNAKYLIVAEWLKLTQKVNLKKYKVDQIYILRKQKNTDRDKRYEETYDKNPVYADVVFHLFNFVRHHLTTDWQGGVEFGLERGYLL